MQEVNSNTATTDLHIDDGGTGGIPLLFVHSFGGSTQQWQEQLKQFRKTRRALAVDLPSHGSSPAPQDGIYSIKRWADELNDFTAKLQLDKFILVGHSMGGSASIALAAKYPEKVAGLVLEGTPGKMKPEQAQQIIGALESDKYDEVMDDYMKKLLAGARPETEHDEMAGMQKLSKDNILKIIKASFDYDPTADLEKYKGPVLILDKKMDPQPGSLQSLFPSLTFKMFEGTSHWIQMDKPAEFNEVIEEFLRENELS